MAKRTLASGLGLTDPGLAGAPNFRETMDVITSKLQELAKTRTDDKPYFFPDGIQLIQVSFNLQGQFSLTVSGGAKALVEKGAASSIEEDK